MRKQFSFPVSSRYDLGGRRWCLLLSSHLMLVRRNVQRKKKVLFSPPTFQPLPVSVHNCFFQVFPLAVPFPLMCRFPACMCVRNQRNQVLQGRAAPRWIDGSIACVLLGRLWREQQCLCSCWREEQHISVEWMPELTAGGTGTQAAVQCWKCAFCQKPN